jgi:hypothetical protein
MAAPPAAVMRDHRRHLAAPPARPGPAEWAGPPEAPAARAAVTRAADHRPAADRRPRASGVVAAAVEVPERAAPAALAAAVPGVTVPAARQAVTGHPARAAAAVRQARAALDPAVTAPAAARASRSSRTKQARRRLRAVGCAARGQAGRTGLPFSIAARGCCSDLRGPSGGRDCVMLASLDLAFRAALRTLRTQENLHECATFQR